MENKLKIDVDGQEIVTHALIDLLNRFPGKNGIDIVFASLEEASGCGMFPTGGAGIATERESIDGHVTQTCRYPITIIRRISGATQARRINTKEWLDNLGKWLEKQTITIDGTSYTLEEYPELTGNRKFTLIERTSSGYMYGTNDNQSEDWMISIVANYRNEFDR